MRTRTKKTDGPFQVVTVPAPKLQAKLNALYRKGLDLITILDRDTASVRLLLKARNGLQEGELIREEGGG